MTAIEKLEEIVRFENFLDKNIECYLKNECSYCGLRGNTKPFLCGGNDFQDRFRNAHEKCVKRFRFNIKELSIQDIFTLQLLCNIQK